MTYVQLLFTRPESGLSSRLDAALLVTLGVTKESGGGEPGAAMSAFKKAVNRWVQETPQGKRAWEESGNDLNVGDLFSQYEDEPSLATAFAEEGLYEVKCVWSLSEGEEYPYDTVLAEHPEEAEGQ